MLDGVWSTPTSFLGCKRANKRFSALVFPSPIFLACFLYLNQAAVQHGMHEYFKEAAVFALSPSTAPPPRARTFVRMRGACCIRAGVCLPAKREAHKIVSADAKQSGAEGGIRTSAPAAAKKKGKEKNNNKYETHGVERDEFIGRLLLYLRLQRREPAARSRAGEGSALGSRLGG